MHVTVEKSDYIFSCHTAGNRTQMNKKIFLCKGKNIKYHDVNNRFSMQGML